VAVLRSGLLHALTGELQSLTSYDSVQSIILHNAYYFGYVIGPPAVYYILVRFGFKSSFITGLGVFTVASLSFWPSSSLLSFPGFVVSNILIGGGLSILQVTANPYIALAGPDELMESRLNFAQALQAVGALAAPLLATKVLFKHVGRSGLFRSQWLYLAVSLWSSLLGIIFYYAPLSEASDDDLERVATLRDTRRGISKRAKVLGIHIIPYIAVSCIFVMWLCLGSQEQLRYYWNDLMAEVKPG
jgi:fucose permease